MYRHRFTHVVTLDFESPVSKHLTLKRMGLREYLTGVMQVGGPLGCSFAIDDDAPTWIDRHGLYSVELLAYLRELGERDDVLFIAHNAGFDMRVYRHCLGLPYPRNWTCTQELSQCVLPHQAGGYGLENISALLGLGDKSGKGDKVMAMTPEQLGEYCKQDVRLCRGIWNRLSPQVHPDELEIGLVCSRVKEMELEVDQAAAAAAVAGFTANADRYAETLMAALDDDEADAVGMEVDAEGNPLHVRSVKPHAVRKLLLENLGFSTQTTSLKKINPIKLSLASGEARAAIEAGAKANGALYHTRKVANYLALPGIDAELTWCGATATMRFAAKSPRGKGVNWHNMPKHDKEVAKLIRSIFRLPPDLCFVRGDEMNVEYRVAGVLAKSRYIHALFEGNPLADPYSEFGRIATGKVISRLDPVRQLWKAAVLGLGFIMSVHRWAAELVKALGKPKPDFTLDDLRKVVEEEKWTLPKGRYYSGIITSLGCDPAVVIVAANTHRRFHEIHPENRQFSVWLMEVAGMVCRGGTQLDVDALYQDPRAPHREWAQAIVDDRFEGKSLAWKLCGWDQPTVIWRDLAVRDLPKRGPALSYIAGKKGYRSLHKSLVIENLVQSAARVRTCRAKLALIPRGYPYIMSVHDELLPAVPRTVEAVLKARDDMLAVLGPNTVHADGFPTWAVMVNPAEINVSQSYYESDVNKLDPNHPDWWASLPNHPELLERLP